MRVSGVEHYANVFRVLRFLRTTAMNEAEVTYRLVVGDNIRVRWAAKLWMRGIASESSLVQLDGCSVYELDGDVLNRTHRLENIVLTGDHSLQPVNLGFAWPHPSVTTPEMAMPFFRSLSTALLEGGAAEPTAVAAPPARSGEVSMRHGQRRVPPPQACLSEDRKETPMERAAREREEMAHEAERLAELRKPKKAEGDGNRFDFSFGLGGAPQECEDSMDCDRPMICCDLFFARFCCSGGVFVGAPAPRLQEQLIPIPVEKDKGGSLPGAPRPPQGPGQVGW